MSATVFLLSPTSRPIKRPLPSLPTEPLAAGLGGCDTGTDALLDQLSLELGNASQYGRDGSVANCARGA